jgi:hypothetical protein
MVQFSEAEQQQMVNDLISNKIKSRMEAENGRRSRSRTEERLEMNRMRSELNQKMIEAKGTIK